MTTKSVRWWKDEAPHQVLLGAYRRVRNCTASQQRETQLTRAVRMYEGRRINGLGADSYSTGDDYDNPKPINITRSGVDTVHAEIVQSKPRPMALTDGGDFAARQQAKKLTKLAEAVLYDSGGDVEAGQCVRDAILGGSGVAKIYEHNNRVRVSRVLSHQLFVDPVEAYQGRPRTLYYVDHVDRAVLGELFPGKAEAIEPASMISRWDGSDGLDDHDGHTADVVEVVEAWRLPSSDTANDGKHIIATSTGVLLEEPWEDDSFPFAFMHFSKPPLGFWGVGAGQRLRGIQKRLDNVDDTIEQCHALLGNGRWLVSRDSNIEHSQLSDNRHGVQTLYSGAEPKWLQIQSVSPELYAHRDWLIQKGFEELGVSQMSATSMKPAGLNSGVSLRYYADIQSKRFIELAQNYQEFYVEIARQSIRCARRLAEKDSGFTVLYRGKSRIERINVAELSIDEDSFILQVFPISMLPGTPAGKLAALQELRADGTISAETFYRLADFPDLDSERELQTAPRDLVDQTIDLMLETGNYIAPEPMQDLALALRVSLLRYQKARLDGTRESELELLRRYMGDAQALAKPPPPPPVPVDPAAPPLEVPLAA